MKLGNPKTNADVQMSEAFVTSVFLALSGGFQDAYTYFTREEVFSNAQTGNIVLMSTHLMMGEWLDVLRYLLPLLAFASGVFFAEKIHVIFKYAKKLHWRQGVLLMEIATVLFLSPSRTINFRQCLPLRKQAVNRRPFRNRVLPSAGNN